MNRSARDADTDDVLDQARTLRAKLDEMTAVLDRFTHALQYEVQAIVQDESPKDGGPRHESRPDAPRA